MKKERRWRRSSSACKGGIPTDRSKKIIRTSIIGIAVNLVLVAFKAAIGLITNSIAILLDAVNNFSDALSSIITIIGTKLANRRPDKKHPYGYGRIEYLTGMLIAVIVLFAGLTSLKESVEKILHPEEASYTVISLIIVAVAVAVKFFVGRYVKGVGQQINSQALVASGSDAFFDAILSSTTLVAAVLSLTLHWKLEGVFGAAISVFIIKAGIEMLLETLNSITGTRADPELTEALKEKVAAYPQVRGVYDITLHNYGPTRTIGSVHVELPDELPAREIHRLTRGIAADVYQALGIILTVGIYAANDSDEEGVKIRSDLEEIIKQYPDILQMHGFYVDEKRVMFDLIIDFAADAQSIVAQVHEQLSERYPDYRFDIVLDSDFSD